MMNLNFNPEDNDSYIIDLAHDDEKIYVLYATGRETEEPYIEHNMEVYRYRMENQVKKYINNYRDYLSRDFRSYGLRKILMILIDINAIYMLYNINPKTWAKVLTIVLMVLFNIYHFLLTSINMLADIGISVEAQALEY